MSEQARDLGREVGVIVFGVLIALAAQQAAEAFSWHQKANDARDALRVEAEENFQLAVERIVVTPCLKAQLDRLKLAVLVEGPKLRPVPTSLSPVGAVVYRHPSRLWTETSWQTAVSDQVISHLSLPERQALSDLYASLAIIRQLNREELGVNGILASLKQPLPVDASVRAHLLETIEAERIRVESISAIAQQALQSSEEVFPSISRVLEDAAWRSELVEAGTTSAFCRRNHLPLASLP